MNDHGYAIFRPEAVRRHTESRDRAVLPRFVSPRTFLALWLSLALITAMGVTAWFVQVPIYAVGSAVAVERPGQQLRGEAIGVVFLPAQFRETLRPGQTVFLDLPGAAARVPRPILEVQPDILSPAAARDRFSLDGAAAGAITAPVVAVFVALAPFPSGLPASAYTGSIYTAEIEIGSRRLLSLLPLVGPLLGGEP